jgi:RNA polymerase sigma factor (sigma-70 family)
VWIDGPTAARYLADDRVSTAMMNAAGRLLDDLIAEDAVQAARVALLTSFSLRPREIGDFIPYAVASTTYEAFKLLRARGRERPSSDRLHAVESDDPVESLQVEMVAERLRLAACLDALPADHRMALLMYAQGLPWAEIGAHLGKPPATVRDWLRDTRAQLRSCLERERDA